MICIKYFILNKGDKNMGNTTIALIVVAITTLFLCAMYILWVKKTPDATKKNRAFILLVGVLIEILIGIGVDRIIGIVVPPTTTPISTLENLDKEININIFNNNNNENYNDNETHPASQSTSTTSENSIDVGEIITTSQTTTQSPKDHTVFLSFEAIPFSFTDNNGDFRVFTSFKAEKVTLYCEVNGVPYGEFNMKTSDLQNWTYDACFYEENTYVITAVAEGTMGEVRSNSVTVEYPF